MVASTLVHRRRFLLVDDDALVLEISKDRLETAGATTFSVDTCADALELAERERPDFVLLDLTVGESVITLDFVMDLQQRLATRERRVILHSAVSATELYRQAHCLAALGAVQKTGDERVFLHRIERLIELSLAIANGATERPSIPY